MATRTAISRLRVVALARSMFAMFAQAMISTRLTATISNVAPGTRDPSING